MRNRATFLVYNALILLVLPIILLYVVARWHRRVFAKGFYRWSDRLGRFDDQGADMRRRLGDRTWWIHAVSLGEVKAIETFLKRASQHSGAKIFLSVVTPEALAYAQEQQLADVVAAAPIDLPWIVRRVLAVVRPKLFISVESEFWPNLLRESHAFGAKVALINGRISARSFRSYHSVRFFLPALWDCFDLFALREPQDAERFKQLGIPESKLHITGHLKYDVSLPPRPTGVPARNGTHAPVVVLGSTREGEEAQLVPILERLRARIPDLRVIVAPRHLERVNELEKIFSGMGIGYGRKTTEPSPLIPLPKGRGQDQDAPAFPLKGEGARKADEGVHYLIWDTFGNLMEAYGQADMAIIGGSFVDKGGQNPIEPAALGLPVVFGPSMENFHGIADILVRSGGARQVALADLEPCLEELLRQPERRKTMGANARQAVEHSQGATERTLQLLEHIA